MDRFSTSRLLYEAADVAGRFLERLDDTPVAATASAESLRARFRGQGLQPEGTDPSAVLRELVLAAEGGITGSTGGRFFGWVIGGALPSAVAADWLTTAWDQNAGLYATSPAASVAEAVAGEWLAELLGIPATASVGFVTGCEMAHVTCLLAARHRVLSERGWNVERDGLAGAPRIRVLAGPERHGSIDRALRFVGLGTQCVERLAGDASGQLDPSALTAALNADRAAPTVVLLQAGDINTGQFDRFSELIPVARARGAWTHVDGAFGLWAAASPRYEHLLRGVDLADSWATDGHKWLNVPFDSGFAFVADAAAHRAAMSYSASYLTHATSERDQMDWNPEWSRRARGFATWAALRELGRRGVASLIERNCDQATALVSGLGALREGRVECPATINQGVVRFVRPGLADDDADNDAFTDAVIAAVLESGEAFFTGTTWRGRRAMRVSVCNWRTTDHDVARAIAAVRGAIERTGRAAIPGRPS